MSEETTGKEAAQDVAALTTCQSCGKDDPNLLRIEPGLRLTLQKAGSEDIPTYVCTSCMKTLRKSASQGAQELAKQELKANHSGQLWKHRLPLVKAGHLCLQRGEYSEAAQSYEKYLKILQLVANVDKRSQLDPKFFNDHPKEITIIASVLWDLMLIYDSNIKFGQKQLETADILSRFVRFSPVYNTIVRKAEKEARKAKNPQAFKQFLKQCDAHTSRCFIANEAFGSRIDPTVITLCRFRDEVLKQSPQGRNLIAFYYKNSPWWAKRLRDFPLLKSVVRPLLNGIAFLLKKLFIHR